MSIQDVQRYGVVRTTLISYGVAAFTWLLSRTDESASAGTASAYVAAGVALQIALIAARAAIKRYLAPDAATQLLPIIELVADGVTVLLFAIGALGGIGRATDEL